MTDCSGPVRSISFPVFVLAALLSLAFQTASAQDETPPEAGKDDAASGEMQRTAEAFLEEVRKKYEIHALNGLESFGMEIRVFSEGVERGQGGNRKRQGRNGFVPPAGAAPASPGDAAPAPPAASAESIVIYDWEAPSMEDIVADALPAQQRRTAQATLRGIWKDIAYASVFAELEGEELSLEGTDEGMAVTVVKDEKTVRSVLFDTESKVVLREERGGEKNRMVILPTYALADGRLRFQGKLVSIAAKGGKGRDGSYRYGGFRTISGFTLPTSLSVNFGASEVRFTFTWTHINGEVAVDDGLDPALIRAKVKEFEKQYSKWSPPEKVNAMKELSTLLDEAVAASIAKKALRDKELDVRIEAAKLLGQMECRNVVPTLAKAMKSNEDNARVFVAVVDALGRIGDPKAVPYLSKDFWGSKEHVSGIVTGRAKISALGRIESKKSVEALIDLLYKFGHGRHGSLGQLNGDVTRALKTLTGQNLGRDREAWKDWWKKNKSKLKLAEDR